MIDYTLDCPHCGKAIDTENLGDVAGYEDGRMIIYTDDGEHKLVYADLVFIGIECVASE